MTSLRMLSGKAESFWIASTPRTNYRPIKKGLFVDVAILGGGIVGISTAFLLKQAGKKVAIVEADRILEGVTGHTTAKLTIQHGLIYSKLTAKFGNEEAKLYAQANAEAIEQVASLVKEKNISCDFARTAAHVYATSKDQLEMIKEELETANELGIRAGFVKPVPLPVQNRGAMVFPNQARFHPRKYLLALAGMIDDESNYIFENCRALDIKEGEPCTIVTDKGEIQAGDVVLATHYPFYDGGGMYYARMYQHRSYIMGIRIDEQFPDGMYINAEEGGGSFRSNPTANGEIVLVGYGGHRTGQADDHIKYYEKLQDFVREIYENPIIEYRWSTQDNITLDGVPYIGRITKDSDHVYVGTGFGKWGMSHGTVAGLMITRMILGQAVPWAELYNPTRFKPIASAKELATHMLSSAKEMAAAYLVSNPTGTPEDLSNGSGELMKYGGEQIGAYKSVKGKVYKVVPYCKHMGCPLVWNNAERSWDCPCHGSRYNYDGSVIQGPATSGLDLRD